MNYLKSIEETFVIEVLVPLLSNTINGGAYAIDFIARIHSGDKTIIKSFEVYKLFIIYLSEESINWYKPDKRFFCKKIKKILEKYGFIYNKNNRWYKISQFILNA